MDGKTPGTVAFSMHSCCFDDAGKVTSKLLQRDSKSFVTHFQGGRVLCLRFVAAS